MGTTSAHAENTLAVRERRRFRRNYLRARGEYSTKPVALLFEAELPPRTRRIPEKNCPQFFHHGTTSAHAENT